MSVHIGATSCWVNASSGTCPVGEMSGNLVEGHFFPVKQCITLFEHCSENVLSEIRDDIKNNANYVIDQSANVE